MICLVIRVFVAVNLSSCFLGRLSSSPVFIALICSASTGTCSMMSLPCMLSSVWSSLLPYDSCSQIM